MQMLRSMTGYGRGEAADTRQRLVVEARSVNHRFGEISIRLPREYAALEDRIRGAVQASVSRGRVEVSVTLAEQPGRPRAVQVDTALAEAYHDGLRRIAGTLGLTAVVEASTIARLPGVLSVDEPPADAEATWNLLGPALAGSLAGLVEMRRREGSRLEEDLRERVRALAAGLSVISARAPAVVEDYRRRLSERLAELLGPGVVDEQRLLLEVTAFAERAGITEELTRFGSHLDQFEQALSEAGPVGRKLDFILQELNREINTIGAKGSDLTIAKTVVELKGELEKIREQVQNIE